MALRTIYQPSLCLLRSSSQATLRTTRLSGLTALRRAHSQDGTEQRVVYSAPLAAPVRQLKLVSLTSASLTLAFLPTVWERTWLHLAVPSLLSCACSPCSLATLPWPARARLRSPQPSARLLLPRQLSCIGPPRAMCEPSPLLAATML